jgi:hypothetical protein
MIFQNRKNLHPFSLLFGGAILACAPFLGGCKGNTTAAALPERIIPPPPVVTAYRTNYDPFDADPLSSETWNDAHWLIFTAPSNTTRSTAPTQAALLFDPSRLFVAFICEKEPLTDVAQDAVSMYLDTTSAGDGTEMIRVSVDSSGHPSCTWIRSAVPAERRDDGSPDFGHPFSVIPNVQIAGLTAHVSQGMYNGKPAWTAVMAIPMRSLPLPLRTSVSPGAHWKFNLMRTIIAGEGGERIQSNLSPVFVAGQEFAPYRLADLLLSE